MELNLNNPEFEAIQAEIRSENNTHQATEAAAKTSELENLEEDFEQQASDKVPPEQVNAEEKKDGNSAFNELIDGEMVVMLADIFLSRLFFFLFRKMFKYDCKVEDFALSAQEAKQLGVLAKEYLKTVEWNMTPGQMLGLGALMIYGGKAAMIIGEGKKVEPEARPKTPKEMTGAGDSTKKRGRGRPRKDAAQ